MAFSNLLDNVTDFLNFKKQKVALNEKFSSWAIEADKPHRSRLRSLFP